eukprot:355102-Chlamydomonas_euryale.AAC.2
MTLRGFVTLLAGPVGISRQWNGPHLDGSMQHQMHACMGMVAWMSMPACLHGRGCMHRRGCMHGRRCMHGHRQMHAWAWLLHSGCVQGASVRAPAGRH